MDNNVLIFCIGPFCTSYLHNRPGTMANEMARIYFFKWGKHNDDDLILKFVYRIPRISDEF